MPEWRIEELAPGIFARTGTNPLQPNSGIIVGDEGVLVIDSGYSTAAGRELRADIQRLTDKPVQGVIISHHHFDHSWGNGAFGGATLIGHSNARHNMLGDQTAYKQRMIDYAPTSAGWYGMAPEQLAHEMEETRIYPPDTTFSEATELLDLVHFHGPRVELRYFGAGHTDGDTVVFLPDAGVVFGGDLVCNHVFPNAMDGDPLHWPEALDQIIGLNARIVVPGHGPPGGPAVLRDFDACLDMLTAEVQRALDDGAPDPRAASEQLRLDDLGDWAGKELLPGTVRTMYRALEAAR